MNTLPKITNGKDFGPYKNDAIERIGADFENLIVGIDPISSQNKKGETLETFYSSVCSAGLNAGVAAAIADVFGWKGGNVNEKFTPEILDELFKVFDFCMPEIEKHGNIVLLKELENDIRENRRDIFVTLLDKKSAPETVEDIYLRLSALSHRAVKPHDVSLDEMFRKLPNVVWTSEGAIDPAELPERQRAARLAGKTLSVNSVDKFPKMTDYVVPSGVRIADSARVRLGAYLGEGTTVMHEGFVNFNAGTMGKSMIEGRISAGVVVGDGSDLGGGCSTMGTLSGGNNTIISVGKNCLVGANAGVGIPLGDRCTTEAGLYVTAGSKVTICEKGGAPTEKVVKAAELSGQDDLLFRRNSQSGQLEVLPKANEVTLNDELHKNN